jgi:zinc protease
VLNSFIFNFDTRAKLINRLMRYKYYGYPPDFIFQYRAGVERVTRADVLQVAQQYIKPQDFAIVVVGHEKDFDKPLTSLGMPVQPLDISIPEPARPTAALR